MGRSVYILGASAELERATRAVRMVRAAGYEVAFDWPANMRREGLRSDRELGSGVRFASMQACLGAATSADIVWLLLPSAGVETVGAWVELGAALASTRSFLGGVEAVLATGSDSQRSIFLEAAIHVGREDEAAIGHLRTFFPLSAEVGVEQEREAKAGNEHGGTLRPIARCGEAR